MSINYVIKFAEDFEEKYLAYKGKILNKYPPVKQTSILNKVLHGSPHTKALNKVLLEDKINSVDSIQNENINITLKPENGYGLFCIGNKSINVGLIEKVPYKLLETLLPFGTIKRIDTVFQITNPITGKYSKDNGLSIKMKESVLKDRLKELQRTLKEEKIHVSLVFDNYKETVSMKYKSG
ncbi:MAG: hypothetical protein NT094_01220 [Candidatus Staskawiczbacteria bacterium]|nr:hypothetical protein [Candidatus Staskawiczbacteria bacterium]